MLNKYSLWVAGAVNMGIIEIKDLTNLKETSFAAAFATGADDDVDDGGDDSVSLPSGVTCKVPGYYQDGYCDSTNNDAACDYDGGDCCADTCGADYDPATDCGTGG
jgi:hypothetical protein